MRKGKNNQENQNYGKRMNEKENINKQIKRAYQKEKKIKGNIRYAFKFRLRYTML